MLVNQILDYIRDRFGDDDVLDVTVAVLTNLGAHSGEQQAEKEEEAPVSADTATKASPQLELLKADVRSIKTLLAAGKAIHVQSYRTGEQAQILSVEGNQIVFDRPIEGALGKPSSNKRTRQSVAENWGIVGE